MTDPAWPPQPLEPAPLSAWWCPRCDGGALSSAGDGWRCPACGAVFPRVADVPCLLPDPELWRNQWAQHLNYFLEVTKRRIEGLRDEAALPALLPRTRARVLRLADGWAAQRTTVAALLAPLVDAAVGALGATAAATAIPPSPEPTSRLPVLDCYENLFRDWAWGEPEAAACRALLAAAVRAPLGDLALFGAGACRLAFDIHQTLGPLRTVALDINPLPSIVANLLLSGHVVTLPEFPVDPHTDAEVVVSRNLACAVPGRPGLSVVFADAFHPPFAAGSLDTVVTSWFIDVAAVDLRQTAALINRLLRPGGSWINLGPLRFRPPMAACYCIEEVFDIVEGSAFEILHRARQEVPYFDSPISGSRRVETVFCFTARKTGATAAPVIPDLVPAWIRDPALPIPVTPALGDVGRASTFTAALVSRIDGTRSIDDLAREIGAAWGTAPALLVHQLRAFLSRFASS